MQTGFTNFTKGEIPRGCSLIMSANLGGFKVDSIVFFSHLFGNIIF